MPNLRKTDFEEVARTVKGLRDAVSAIASDPPAYRERRLAQAFDSAARDLAVIMARHSGTFNRAKFLKQTGVK